MLPRCLHCCKPIAPGSEEPRIHKNGRPAYHRRCFVELGTPSDTLRRDTYGDGWLVRAPTLDELDQLEG